MSRYLEMTVEGSTDRVGERALRAFRRVGRVQRVDLSEAQIEGVIRIGGEPAQTRVSWRQEGDHRSRLDIAATSDDTLSRAADSALYTYARSYKAVGWPDPERDRIESRKRLVKFSIGGALGVALLLGAYLAVTFFRGR